MKRFLFFVLILLGPVHARASWWGDFCSRHLIAADPYEFETASDAFVQREIERLRIRVAWKKADADDVERLKILEAEVRKREAIAEILKKGSEQ